MGRSLFGNEISGRPNIHHCCSSEYQGQVRTKYMVPGILSARNPELYLGGWVGSGETVQISHCHHQVHEYWQEVKEDGSQYMDNGIALGDGLIELA